MADGTLDLSDHLARNYARVHDQNRVLALTARIVSAHIGHNRVGCAELPSLIQEVSRTLAQMAVPSFSSGRLVPAVPPGHSVFPDYIICLENGLRFRTLRRHLMAAYGLTPEQYRRRWGLPYDYPMVAPSYTRNRSSVAKAAGLGRRRPAAAPPDDKPGHG